MIQGPLYHVCQAESLQLAVGEAARVLKSGALLFAAAINRLSYLRDLLRFAPPIGYAHLSTAAAMRELLAPAFTEVALAGIESFSSAWQARLNDLPAEEAEAWLDLIERTGETAEGLGCSDHFLYVGRKAG